MQKVPIYNPKGKFELICDYYAYDEYIFQFQFFVKNNYMQISLHAHVIFLVISMTDFRGHFLTFFNDQLLKLYQDNQVYLIYSSSINA